MAYKTENDPAVCWTPLSNVPGFYHYTVIGELLEEAQGRFRRFFRRADRCQDRKLVHFGTGSADFNNETCMRLDGLTKAPVLPFPTWMRKLADKILEQRLVTRPLDQVHSDCY